MGSITRARTHVKDDAVLDETAPNSDASLQLVQTVKFVKLEFVDHHDFVALFRFDVIQFSAGISAYTLLGIIATFFDPGLPSSYFLTKGVSFRCVGGSFNNALEIFRDLSYVHNKHAIQKIVLNLE